MIILFCRFFRICFFPKVDTIYQQNIFFAFFHKSQKKKKKKKNLNYLIESVYTIVMWMIVIAGDWNAHHRLWGSNDNNSRGDLLMAFVSSNNLIILNDGSITYDNNRTQSHSDLTMVNQRASSFVNFWAVEDCESFFDHKLISFVYNSSGEFIPKSLTRKYCTRIIDWSLFRSSLSLNSFIEQLDNISDSTELNDLVNDLMMKINYCCENSLPKIQKNHQNLDYL